jgi:succinate dehydrogenase / fumarate reductase membrane anchor subunit
MAFLTDRKRAEGLGSARAGTEHHISMMISSVALVVLVVLFIAAVAPVIGAPYEVVTSHFARPFPAIVTALLLVVGFHHFRGGVQVTIEDYTDGLTRKALIVLMILVSYGAMATGLFAVARLAL